MAGAILLVNHLTQSHLIPGKVPLPNNYLETNSSPEEESLFQEEDDWELGQWEREGRQEGKGGRKRETAALTQSPILGIGLRGAVVY